MIMKSGRGIAVGTLLAFGLIAGGCSSDSKDKSSDSKDSKQEKSLKVGLAYDLGGRGDKSFNDAAAEGLDKAKDDLGVEAKELEPAKDEDRKTNLDTLAKTGFNPVIGVGFSFADVLRSGDGGGDLAAAYPKTTFAVIDGAVDGAPNVKGLVFAENEGSFLVGAAAALKSKTGHVGFIGGVEIDLIKKFEAGFTAGAQKINPDIKVDVKYLTPATDFSGFRSPDKAKEAAKAMYEGGADVVFHAAGGSGSGLFDAAVEAGDGKWAIGVDSDQYETATAEQRPHILTSMVKRVDVAVFGAIKDFKDGKLSGGGVTVYDLKADGVGYATSGGFVDDISAQLDDLKAKIISGDIKVPEKPGA